MAQKFAPPPILTIRHILAYLAPSSLSDPSLLEELIYWPPDIFAVTGYLLHKSGAYQCALDDDFWDDIKSDCDAAECKSLGNKWRNCAVNRLKTPAVGSSLSPKIRGWWKNVLKHSEVTLEELRGCETRIAMRIIRDLLNLVACSDEACHGLGLPDPPGETKGDTAILQKHVTFLLGSSFKNCGASSMCLHIAPGAVCVLPRVHTPQVGFTFRSLSHHLALWPKDELAPFWFAEIASLTGREEKRMHLLLIPIPHSVKPTEFKPVPGRRAGRHDMDNRFQHFKYVVNDNSEWIANVLPQMLEAAISASPDGRLDGVIFPELSLRDSEFRSVVTTIAERSPEAFVIAGVQKFVKTNGRASKKRALNAAKIMVPVYAKDGQVAFICEQFKHHRWLLEGNQIKTYKFGGSSRSGMAGFESSRLYWEDMSICPREVNFFPLKQSLTMCVLVCEDLARQDPVARLLRTVGPTLLVTLLMDGPQHNWRWPARYASVLAEDPGTSVLTITSEGMARLDSRDNPNRPSICIGSWRHALGNALPILLEEGSAGVLISPKPTRGKEFSSDGREAEAHFLELNEVDDIRQIKLPP
jgi:hypothetical protein